jgi:transposase InsO family protein
MGATIILHLLPRSGLPLINWKVSLIQANDPVDDQREARTRRKPRRGHNPQVTKFMSIKFHLANTQVIYRGFLDRCRVSRNLRLRTVIKIVEYEWTYTD